MLAKTSCQHCGMHIEFDVDAANQVVDCPSCSKQTFLSLVEQAVSIPPALTTPKAKSKNLLPLFFAIGGFILIIMLVGISALLGTARKQIAPIQKYTDTLQEVASAMGWNLGDVLPDQFQVKIDDDAFGITYDFNPPADTENASMFFMSHLILTADRQIAAICLTGQENEQFKSDTLQKVLREKYGLRQSMKIGFGGIVNYYYGQTNRQVVLSISSQFKSVDLEYRDERLCDLAKKQTEARKSEVNQQLEKSLKGKL